MKKEKLIKRILVSQNNVKFKEFINLIEAFEFYLVRVNGSHHIFKHDGSNTLLNIQNVKGEVKPYQIKQFLFILEKYNLKMKD
jgi:predicted RNA binding protein YcfA (HicA-like mRNA interferase family)